MSVKVVKNDDGTFSQHTVAAPDGDDDDSSGLDSDESVASGMYSCSDDDGDDGHFHANPLSAAAAQKSSSEKTFAEKARRLSMSKLGRIGQRSSTMHKANEGLLAARTESGVVRL